VPDRRCALLRLTGFTIVIRLAQFSDGALALVD
jgi:hypothetical protein